MPGKQRHGKRKFSPQSRNIKSESARSTIPAQPSAATEIREPISRPKTGGAVSTPTIPLKVAAARHVNVSTELRTIGILAGVLLVAIIVIAIALS